jgi:uncharacterized protein with PIN domain
LGKEVEVEGKEKLEIQSQLDETKQSDDMDRAGKALKETEKAHEETKKDRNEYRRQLNDLSKTSKRQVEKLKSEHLAELTERQHQYGELRSHDSRHHKTGVTAAVTEVTI